VKTDVHFSSHLAQFLLEREMFQTKVVEKIETHILCSTTFSRKSCLLCSIVEKYGEAGQATDNNTIRHMRIACCIPKATNTHSQYVILLFHGNNGYANAPQCYVIRSLHCPSCTDTPTRSVTVLAPTTRTTQQCSC
jgi:hypothetical protein